MKQVITDCREAALAILKPSRRELEHGLELHRDAFVCESYGFTPTGLMLRGMEQGVITPNEFNYIFEQQIHVDYLQKPEWFAECQEAWEASGVDAMLVNAGQECNHISTLLKRLANLTCLPDRYPQLYARATTVESLHQARREGRKALILTTNGVPLCLEPPSVTQSLFALETFAKLGVRMMHLTYNRRNPLGDGCGEHSDAGLSQLGEQVIDAMNRIGVIPDVAHSGQRTSLEAALRSRKPVVASHTGMRKLSTHYRCKEDEVCRAIANSGGYVGICGMPQFLQGSGRIDQMMAHIDYAVETLGADHVAIGTDNGYWVGGNDHDWDIFPKGGENFESLWRPEPEFELKPGMRETMAWTNFPLFTVGMVQHGHSDDDIRKILGGNVLRVLRATLLPLPQDDSPRS